MALSIQSSNQALTFKLTNWNNAAKVITAVDNLLTGFSVMSCGAQAIIIFPIQCLTYDRNPCKQITKAVRLQRFSLVRACLWISLDFNVAFNNSLFSRTCIEGTGCICQRDLIKRTHYKLLKKSSTSKHMVSVLQAQPLLLLSTGTVMFSALSIQMSFSRTPQKSATLPGATVPPTARGEGVSLLPFLFPCLQHQI